MAAEERGLAAVAHTYDNSSMGQLLNSSKSMVVSSYCDTKV